MHQGPTNLDVKIAALDLLDHREVDWKRVERTAYLIHQHLRYDYPGPIADLQQRLMIIPPAVYGDQRRVVYRLEVSGEDAETTSREDEYGNLAIHVHVPRVDAAINFEAWAIVERYAAGPPAVPAHVLTAPRFLEPSPLTQPDAALEKVATELRADRAQGEELAQRISDWVHGAITYAHDITSVHSTAAQALALGQGVCQDYAHIMIALCRLCGIPARYVSGHLLGEGGTHAWVEALLPSPGDPQGAIAIPFDPTNGCRASLSYITIAVGRDYYDVAPTSGTFRASYGGQLSARKKVGLTILEYAQSDSPEQ